MEAEVLERIGEREQPPEQPNYPRRTVLLLVDSFDPATLGGVRYARGLRPTPPRAGGGVPGAGGRGRRGGAGPPRGGYARGRVTTGGAGAGGGDGRPVAPPPPASAMRGLLPGRRFRQRRGESAPDAAAADQASY